MRFGSKSAGWNATNDIRACRVYAWRPVWVSDERCWVWLETVWRHEDYAGGTYGVLHTVNPPSWLAQGDPEAVVAGAERPKEGQVVRIGAKWRRMAEMYRRFGADFAEVADWGEAAAGEMFLHESRGAPLRLPLNGYAVGKKWMDVTVAQWREDVASGLLKVEELLDDGYPGWFLERVGLKA